jgi:MoaA/NifB/PqqE/SkfB family radical SAM enzyme
MNILRLGMAVMQSRMGTLSLPYKLNLYLTDQCNCKCITCNIWKKRSHELSVDELAVLFRSNPHLHWVDVTGGEIFLRKDIEEVFSCILRNAKGLHILHFPTNGMLTKKISSIAHQIRHEFTGRLVVSVSIDGPPEVHDSLRGVEGCWSRAVQTYKHLKSITGVDVFVGYTASKHNAGMLQDTFEAIRNEAPDLVWEDVHMNVAQPSKIYYGVNTNMWGKARQSIFKDLQLLIDKRVKRRGLFQATELSYLKKMADYLQNERYPLLKCQALKATITVMPSGDVYPCLFFDRKLGSLKHTNFQLDRILEKEMSKELKRDILKHCPHCWSACEAYPTLLANELFLPYLRG